MSRITDQLNELKPHRGNLLPDAIAGLSSAWINIPNGMAFAQVAGVNPILGLYSVIAPPIFGALFTGSVFMAVILTNETALMAASIIEDLNIAGATIGAIFLLTLMTGVWQILFALMGWGSLLRFVSESVLTGFITGTVVLVIIGQSDIFFGVSSSFDHTLVSAVDVYFRPWTWDIPTTLVGLSTIIFIAMVNRTRLHHFSLILSLLATSLAVALLNLDTVTTIGEVTMIPTRLPAFTLPNLNYVVRLLLPSLALAILSNIVAAGVAKNYPNPDGRISKMNQNILGLGAANVAGGLFQALPVTGSLPRTGTIINLGARSRWANIFSGIIVAIVVVTIAPVFELIPLSAIGGLLMYSAVSALNQRRFMRTWEVGLTDRIASVATFLLTLTIPIQGALFAGILFSFAIYIYKASVDVQIQELIPLGNARFETRPLPESLPPRQPVVLLLYGSSFFAATETLDRFMPNAEELEKVAIILITTNRQAVNNTFLTWVEQYDLDLRRENNRLILAEVDPGVKKQMAKVGTLDIVGEENVFLAQRVRGASIDQAVEAAEAWISSIEKPDE